MESGTKEINYRGIRILYEDNHIIVCIKPEGVLSQADSTKERDMVTILKQYLVEKYDKPGNAYVGLVHRLDRRVSGVMVFAKTSKAASRLSLAIRNNEIKKTYYAIATGNIADDGTLVNKVNEKAVSAKDGKDARLDYKVVNHFEFDKKEYSICRVDLQTGRFNQIRAQFSLFGHPLINDYKYGYIGKTDNDYSHIGLFCVELTFIHPVTKQTMTFIYDNIINRSVEDWSKYFRGEVTKYEG